MRKVENNTKRNLNYDSFTSTFRVSRSSVMLQITEGIETGSYFSRVAARLSRVVFHLKYTKECF